MFIFLIGVFNFVNVIKKLSINFFNNKFGFCWCEVRGCIKNVIVTFQPCLKYASFVFILVV
jgi:hypothetical protein